MYICNDKIHTRKSEVLNFFDKLKFDEKADITMHSRSMQPSMFLKLTYNPSHNIVELYNILKIQFTTSKRRLDI